ncbi:MAG: UDP-3-O-acyl-N-acetylglucosamine deacetylase [Acidobacteria bacterium]|nr:UDP-3-O-acyl-N-acetylglucosamine deacetylase [Acidobacteriota bacterium]
MFWQKTIRREVTSTGIGLHSGKKVRLKLKPALADTGVVFKRIDKDGVEIKVNDRSLSNTNRATSIAKNDIFIDTVEHLMAALVGAGVDNVIIELDSSEVPAMDGSASPFLYLIHEAGVRRLNKKRNFMRILKPIEIRDNGKFIAVYPSDTYRITYGIEFDHPAIKKQEASFEINNRIFTDEIAPARTFGFLKEVELLRRNNLARGGSLENAIILDDHKVINNPLRYDDEFVRHKILDAVGDFAFLPYRVLGHIVASKAGHAMHMKLVDELLTNREYWELLNETAYEKLMQHSTQEEAALSLA